MPEKTAPCTTATPLSQWNGSVKGNQIEEPTTKPTGREGGLHTRHTHSEGQNAFPCVCGRGGEGVKTNKPPPRAAPCGPDIILFLYDTPLSPRVCVVIYIYYPPLSPRACRVVLARAPSPPLLPPSPVMRCRPPGNHEAKSRHRRPAQLGQYY